MSRVAWAFIAGLALLAVGLIIAPSGLGVGLVVIGLVLLGSLPFVINRNARRSPGWTRVWNPRAARREYKAELDARERRERDLASPDGDQRGT